MIEIEYKIKTLYKVIYSKVFLHHSYNLLIFYSYTKHFYQQNEAQHLTDNSLRKEQVYISILKK